MEYLRGGELKDFWNQRKRKVSEKVA